MDKYKVVIVDDDDVALENLSFELWKDARFSLEGTARNGRKGKKLIMKVQPDLLFLDVEMPDMTGLELLQEIRDYVSWNMRVVFYTAYDKYMIQAIREAAFDYLLKPFDERDLKEILTRFTQQVETTGQRVSFPVGNPMHTGQTFIVFTPTNDMRALRPAEIGFFRYCSERKQWEVVLNDQLPLALRRGMTAEQITSFSPCFVQIHQSYIINIDYLMLIRDNRCVLYPPFDKITELLVSKKFKKELQERFCLWKQADDWYVKLNVHYSNNVDKQKKGYRGHLPVSFFCFICFPYLCRKYMLLYFNAFVLQCNFQNFCIVGILLFIQSSFH